MESVNKEIVGGIILDAQMARNCLESVIDIVHQNLERVTSREGNSDHAQSLSETEALLDSAMAHLVSAIQDLEEAL